MLLDAGEKAFRAAADDYNRRNLAIIAKPTWADLDKASEIVSGLPALRDGEMRKARRDLDALMGRLAVNFPTLKKSGYYSLDVALRQMGFDNLTKAYKDLGGFDKKNYEELYKGQELQPKPEVQDKEKAEAEKAEAEKAEPEKKRDEKPVAPPSPPLGQDSRGANLFASPSSGAPGPPAGPRTNNGPSPKQDAKLAEPRRPYPGAKTKTSLRNFLQMQQAAGDQPFGFRADDFDHNFSFVYLKPTDGNNLPYRVRRDNSGYQIEPSTVFDFCENGKSVRYKMFASRVADVVI
jgi:hypothetical protein